MTGDTYFSKTALTIHRVNEKLVRLAIADFMMLAAPIPDPDPKPTKSAKVHNLVVDGTPFETLPHLSFRLVSPNVAQVIGHEGRHRALELQKRGVTEIPVLLRHKHEPSFPDCCPRLWRGQGKNSRHVIALPASLVANGEPAYDHNLGLEPRKPEIPIVLPKPSMGQGVYSRPISHGTGDFPRSKGQDGVKGVPGSLEGGKRRLNRGRLASRLAQLKVMT